MIQMSRVQKKTFLEKQQVKKKETIAKSLLSCPPYISTDIFPLEKDSSVITKLERQVPRFQQ